MPELKLDGLEPWADTLAIMLYPGEGEERLRRGWTAKHWARFYADAASKGILSLGAETLAELLTETSFHNDQNGDMRERGRQGFIAGQTLLVAMATAETASKSASWNEAAKFMGWSQLAARTAVFEARARFGSVAHLWAAWIMRDQRFWEAPAIGYTFLTDLAVFIREAETILEWGVTFKLPRQKAAPLLELASAWRTPDEWRPPLEWLPNSPREAWPRDGEVRRFMLPPEWQVRVGKSAPKGRAGRKPVRKKSDK